MLLNLVACVAGIAILVVAADAFVLGAARLAIRLAIAPVIVGAIVIGFGTSSPELLVGIIASASGEIDLALGSVVGSNAANLTLVAGIAATVTPLAVTSRILRREVPLVAGAAVAILLVLALDLGRPGGALLLGAFVGSLVLILRRDGGEGEGEGDELEREASDFLIEPERASRSMRPDLARLIAGLAGTLLGAQALVWGSTGIADRADLSGGVVGLTLVAVGTSLPEIATATQAARRGQGELVAGNVLGSCLFNGLAIAGLAAMVGGTTVGSEITLIAAPATLAVTLLAAVTMWSGRSIRRAEGVLLIIAWIGLVILLAI